MSDVAENEGQSLQEFVSFRIGTREFCVDIMSVQEIRGWGPATVLPHAPAYVCGVVNLRGTVLPIIDLAERLGLPKTDPTATHVTIVVQIGKRIIGLLVDAVSDILQHRTSDIQPTPEAAAKVSMSFLRGLINLGDRMICVVSLEQILPDWKEAAI